VPFRIGCGIAGRDKQRRQRLVAIGVDDLLLRCGGGPFVADSVEGPGDRIAVVSGDCSDAVEDDRALEQDRLPVVRGLAMAAEDFVRADIIQSVMCRGRVDFAAVERRFGIRFDEHFGRELEGLTRLAGDGLVCFNEYGFTVTPRGRLLLRVIAMVFDASFHKNDAPARFSRVI
jgi:hypothetical protein